MTTTSNTMLTRQINNGCYRLDYDWINDKAVYLNGKKILGVLAGGRKVELITCCAVFNAEMAPAWDNLDDDNITMGDVWACITKITR